MAFEESGFSDKQSLKKIIKKKITKYKTVGVMKHPITITAKKKQVANLQGDFLANLLVTNPSAIFLTYPVWENAYVNINVNSKNANVSFPNEFWSVVFIPSDGTKASVANHSKLGHPIPTIIHKNSTDIKIPRTFIPSALSPDGGVAIKNMAITKRAIRVQTTSFSLFVINVDFFFLRTITLI